MMVTFKHVSCARVSLGTALLVFKLCLEQLHRRFLVALVTCPLLSNFKMSHALVECTVASHAVREMYGCI